jgi:hypothetical protein
MLIIELLKSFDIIIKFDSNLILIILGMAQIISQGVVFFTPQDSLLSSSKTVNFNIMNTNSSKTKLKSNLFCPHNLANR